MNFLGSGRNGSTGITAALHADQRAFDPRQGGLGLGLGLLRIELATGGISSACAVGGLSLIPVSVRIRTASRLVAGCSPGPAPTLQVVVCPRNPAGPKVLDVPVDPALLAAGDHNGSTCYRRCHFADVAARGTTPQVRQDDGWWAVVMGKAAQISVRTGQAVTRAALQATVTAVPCPPGA